MTSQMTPPILVEASAFHSTKRMIAKPSTGATQFRSAGDGHDGHHDEDRHEDQLGREEEPVDDGGGPELGLVAIEVDGAGRHRLVEDGQS